MPIWVFGKVARNRFCDREGPKRLYSWEVRQHGSEMYTSSGCTYAELEPLLDYYQVSRPEELVGKRFISERLEASSALNLFTTIVRHNGTYTPPAASELHERAAKALSEGKCPDYSDVDNHTVACAFSEVFAGFRLDEGWFKWFQELIADQSGGRVSLSKCDKKRFKLTVRGIAEYLQLTVDGNPRRLIFGPYNQPFSFDAN